MAPYPRLFEPGRIGSLALPNRLLMAPMGTGYADADGGVTPQLIAYHAERAAGGVGLIITEHTAVAANARTTPTMLGLYKDRHVSGFRDLCRAVHAAGARIAVQLNHGGRQADPMTVGELVAPSPFRSPSGTAVARPLTVDEIRELVRAFGIAASRARAAGADAVELHLAHGYLGCSFLSPLTNQRTDEYGGSTGNRCRFPQEVLREIRRLCGPDFPLWCRISADEFIEGGLTLREAMRIAPLLEEAGAQAIHVSGCLGETARFASAPYYEPSCNLAHLAEGVRQVVNGPVIAVGKILSPDDAEGLLARGVCDFVALGRPLLADPEWPTKAREGRVDDIRPCIACNLGCLHRRVEPTGVCLCLTNPRTGREHEWPRQRPLARSPRRVLVIGGGPAGMTAAAELAASGHRVELWEAQDRLGGAYRLACLPPGKDDLRPFLAYMERRLGGTGVKLQLRTKAAAEAVAAAGAEVVVVAAGAEQPSIDCLPGADPERTFLADHVLAGSVSVGRKVAVVGGGRTGTETAHFLAEQGRSVALVELRTRIADEIPTGARAFLAERLEHLGVQCLTDTEALYATPEGLVIGQAEADPSELRVDSIVLAQGRLPRAWLAHELEAAGVPRVVVIGDARRPRSAQEAVYEGARLAVELAAEEV